MYRPCNEAEYRLVEASEFKAWPPRLEGQPIFYPVANLEYAREVNAWNVSDSGRGYVLKFEVDSEWARKYPLQVVGAARHEEWWIPAEDLASLNDHIIGLIELVEVQTRKTS